MLNFFKNIFLRFGALPKQSSIKLGNLEISTPRTPQEIQNSYAQGRFAEMTPHQAGLDDSGCVEANKTQTT